MTSKSPPDFTSEVFCLARVPPVHAQLLLKNITVERVLSTPPGSMMHGALFSAHGAMWKICVYLGGNTAADDNRDRVSAFVMLETPGFGKKLQFLVRIGDKHVQDERLFSTLSKDGLINSWGSIHMLKHTELTANPSRYITDGVMTVSVTLSDLSAPFETPPKVTTGSCIGKIAIPPSRLSLDMLEMLRTGVHSDVTLSCGGESFQVHASIISQRSSTFAAHLAHCTSSPPVLAVDESIKPCILRRLLEYMYGDDVYPTSAEEARRALSLHLYCVCETHEDTVRRRSTCTTRPTFTTSLGFASYARVRSARCCPWRTPR